MLTEDWPLEKIRPYPKNPRKISDAAISKVAASISAYGFRQPIVVDEKGEIVVGHTRRLAALRLKLKTAPVHVARGLTEEQLRAYRIADNRTGEESEWDSELLGAEIAALAPLGIDLPALGFELRDLSDLGLNADGSKAPLDSPDGRELEGEELQLWLKAWRSLIAQWRGYLDGSRDRGLDLSQSVSRAGMAVSFLRALFYGNDIPRFATLAYTPHRLFVHGDKLGSIIDAFAFAQENDSAVAAISWLCHGKPDFEKMLSQSGMPVQGRKCGNDFPALLARDLIDEFCEPGAVVLDPCHGWGGRMLGFMLSRKAVLYRGFDVDKATQDGVQLLFDDLLEYAGEKSAHLQLMPFEDAQLEDASCNFALTSPPYFDTEKYEGEQSSWRRYGDFESWVDGFYEPLIEKTAAALKSGGVFCLQVGSQRYPLVDIALRIASRCGLRHVETRHAGMTNNQAKTAEEDGEVVVILRKRKKRERT